MSAASHADHPVPASEKPRWQPNGINAITAVHEPWVGAMLSRASLAGSDEEAGDERGRPNSFAAGRCRRQHGVMAERFDVGRDGASLAAERWPGGGQTVVLLHEGVADRRGWAEVAGLLAPELTVIAYDRRGYGQTPPSTEPLSHLDDLLAVLDHAGTGPVWPAGGAGLHLTPPLPLPAGSRAFAIRRLTAFSRSGARRVGIGQTGKESWTVLAGRPGG